MAYTLLVFLFNIAVIYAHREHKVHNIVLYPEKHSWCKTTPIKQVVGHPGCEPIEVDNNVCVGACFSYSIPRTEPTAPGEVAPYCDSCQPSRVTWKHVTLTCTDSEQNSMSKSVEIIENCSCLACRQVDSDDSDLESTSVDVPQLLHVMSQPKNASLAASHLKQSSRLNTILKTLTNGSEEGDDQLMALLSEVKESGIEEDELQGLVEKSEENGQVKVGITKLKLLLSKLEKKHLPQPVETEELPIHRHQHKHHHETNHHKEKEPTLDVDAVHMRPAVEGSEVTYLPKKHPRILKIDEEDGSGL